MTDSGRLSGSCPTGQAPAGLDASRFDPGRALAVMAAIETALVLTAEHNPTIGVGSFVDSSIQFRDLADFLHAHQHMEVPE